MYRTKRIAVIIPAFNEAEAIADTLRAIPRYADTVIVCDNGSTDGTGEIADNPALHPGVCVVREERHGYGNACMRGMQELRAEDIVVFLDADLSDDPANMPLLLDPIIDDGADTVISNRFTPQLKKGAMSLPQRFGNKLAVFLVRLLWGYAYGDLGPFRSIRRDALISLDMEDANYGWTIELQVKALARGLQIAQADVPYYTRAAGRSKVSGTVKGVVLAGWKIITRIFWYSVTEGIRRKRTKR